MEVGHRLVWMQRCKGLADDRASSHQLITLHVGHKAMEAPEGLLVVQPGLQAFVEGHS